MSLVITSLGGKHTYKQQLCGQDQFLETWQTPAMGQHAHDLKIRLELLFVTAYSNNRIYSDQQLGYKHHC